MTHVRAADIHHGQTWRLCVAQRSDQHNAEVDFVDDEGWVHFVGTEDSVSVGSLLASWRLVA